MRKLMVWALAMGCALQLLGTSSGFRLRTALPQEWLQGFDGLVQDYLRMKDALVAGNTWGAALAGSRMVIALPQIDDTGLTPIEMQSWAAFQNKIHTPCDQISGSGDIQIQRRYFSTLSIWMYKAVEMLGAGKYTLTVQFCPMAESGKGAVWLSQQDEIQNPYFGEEMLHCGRKIAEIEGLERAAPLAQGMLPGKLIGNHVHGCHGPGR